MVPAIVVFGVVRALGPVCASGAGLAVAVIRAPPSLSLVIVVAVEAIFVVVVLVVFVFFLVVVARVVAVDAAALVEGLRAFDSAVRLDLSFFVLIRRFGLLEDGDEVLALEEKSAWRGGGVAPQMQGGGTYSADDLARVVDNGDGLFERHGERV